jgi:hypothetical protein
MYTFIPPEGKAALQADKDPGDQDAAWQTVTLSLPGDTPLAVPADPARWERRNGCIVATYTREELRLAVGLALEQKRAELETRLERGLEMLARAAGRDAEEIERLLAHWEALDAEYITVVEKLREVIR